MPTKGSTVYITSDNQGKQLTQDRLRTAMAWILRGTNQF